MPLKIPALTKQQKKNLMAGALFVAVFGYVYWNYLLKPVEARIDRQRAEVERLASEVTNAREQAKRLPQIQKEYETAKAELSDLEKQLPAERDLPGLLRLVTRGVLRYHLRLSSLTPGNAQDQEHYRSFPIQIVLTGRFHNLGRFLTSIGVEERILSADSLSLQRAGGGDADPTVQASFTLMAYMSKG